MTYTPSPNVRSIYDLYNKWKNIPYLGAAGIGISGALFMISPVVAAAVGLSSVALYTGSMIYASALHKRYLDDRDVEFREWLDELSQLRW